MRVIAYCCPTDPRWEQRMRSKGARVYSDEPVVIWQRWHDPSGVVRREPQPRYTLGGACDVMDAVAPGVTVVTPGGRLENPHLPDLHTDAEAAGARVVSTIRRRRAKAADGKCPVGPLPYGYRRKGGAAALHEERADVVRLIFHAYCAGATLRAVAEELNATGVPTAKGTRWQAENVRFIVRNPAYKGEPRSGGTLPAIVTPEVWETAQASRRERARAPSVTPRAPLPLAPGVSRTTYRQRIRAGWSPDRAASEPPRQRLPEPPVPLAPGVSIERYRQRLHAGWSPERAAAEPLRKP
jgi:hypothetical protein